MKDGLSMFLEKGVHRNRLEILMDILLVLENRSLKRTRVMHESCLGYKVFEKYMKDALDVGLIVYKDGSLCSITEKGNKFLTLLEEHEKKREEIERYVSQLDEKRKTLEKMSTLYEYVTKKSRTSSERKTMHACMKSLNSQK
jgi:predicted transcriptional regulator